MENIVDHLKKGYVQASVTVTFLMLVKALTILINVKEDCNVYLTLASFLVVENLNYPPEGIDFEA